MIPLIRCDSANYELTGSGAGTLCNEAFGWGAGWGDGFHGSGTGNDPIFNPFGVVYGTGTGNGEGSDGIHTSWRE